MTHLAHVADGGKMRITDLTLSQNYRKLTPDCKSYAHNIFKYLTHKLLQKVTELNATLLYSGDDKYNITLSLTTYSNITLFIFDLH
jgi:CO dehydrogenase/acetyl-CoA synthase delta subunit